MECDTLCVRVRYKGENLELDATAADQVSVLSTKLAKRTGLAPAKQRLICRGRVLNDNTIQLGTLLPTASARELSMMLMPLDSDNSCSQHVFRKLARQVLDLAAILWAIIYRFFHSLLVPTSYAGEPPKGKHVKGNQNNGPQAGDLAGLAAACGAGG